jgi:high affinity cAMP-specific and IBMX-insensitive 3',5'-cyclic phosphodiesterase 8
MFVLFSSFFFTSFFSKQKFNDGKFPHLIPPNPSIRALLVFHKDDQVSDAMTRSCERLNIESSRARNAESALEQFQSPNGGHHLVIVDGRCKNIDIESFGRLVHGFYDIDQ